MNNFISSEHRLTLESAPRKAVLLFEWRKLLTLTKYIFFRMNGAVASYISYFYSPQALIESLYMGKKRPLIFDITKWIGKDSSNTHLKMEVIASGIAGTSHIADYLTGGDHSTRRNSGGRHVRVACREPGPIIN